ncbi:hypothetical protein N425_12285 [Tannerella sp. oral taxon BU063 isolate Cell 2]|uniref:Uncharacterized protein n=1 Tax=Tannerella sp. oral taxon BU063 isolate Cell 2 TaxID=1411148 RepID=W2C169_9BACT|nr:hypothetical protein N425_12285 [Tannerella sp. oral taxon BU063 isolate Cell 2]
MKASELVPGKWYMYAGRDGVVMRLRFESASQDGQTYAFRSCGAWAGVITMGRPMVESMLREVEQ